MRIDINKRRNAYLVLVSIPACVWCILAWLGFLFWLDSTGSPDVFFAAMCLVGVAGVVYGIIVLFRLPALVAVGAMHPIALLAGPATILCYLLWSGSPPDHLSRYLGLVLIGIYAAVVLELVIGKLQLSR